MGLFLLNGEDWCSRGIKRNDDVVCDVGVYVLTRGIFVL